MRDGSLVFTVDAQDGGYYPMATVRMTQYQGDQWWDWLRSPYSFWWTLALSGLTVVICVLPFAWHLTRRLEALQRNVLRSVQRWEQGDLTVRLPDASGDDEVANLTRNLNTAAERIAALIQAHKSLLANASHELRSPLARIRMAVELAGPSDDARRQTARQEILRNLNEIDQVVEEILLTSRLQTDGADLGAIEPVDLIGLLAEECAHVNATLNVAPELAADPDLATVQGIPRLLRRAVRNLLENATRYGVQPGLEPQISAQIECAAGMGAGAKRDLLIHVEDNGPGVPLELRERIFEPFYRVPGVSDNDSGVGLGLPLVRSIAQRHGGDVICDQRPGGGARFTLRLPMTAHAT
jgi:signal transduction histidine kinase